jgi:chromosome segregation ATPase
MTENTNRNVFGLHGVSGMLIATVLLLLILAGLTTLGLAVQQREANNPYSLAADKLVMSSTENIKYLDPDEAVMLASKEQKVEQGMEKMAVSTAEPSQSAIAQKVKEIMQSHETEMLALLGTLENSAVQKQAEELKQQNQKMVDELKSEITELKKDKDSYANNTESLEKELSQLKDEKSAKEKEYVAQVGTLETKVATLERDATENEAKYTEQIKGFSDKIKQLQNDAASKDEEHASALQSLQGEISQLKESIEEQKDSEKAKSDLEAQMKEQNDAHVTEVEELNKKIETLEDKLRQISNIFK